MTLRYRFLLGHLLRWVVGVLIIPKDGLSS